MTSRLAQWTTWNLLAFWLATAGAHAREPVLDRLSIEPTSTVLDGGRASAQLIATGQYGDGSVRDLTHAGAWTSTDPAIVVVHPGGRIEPRGDGQAEVASGAVRARRRRSSRFAIVGKAHPIQFAHEVLPALTKAGLQRGCLPRHSRGQERLPAELARFQSGARLRDPARENGTRRTNPFEPEASLILLKGTGQAAHEGGKRMGTESIVVPRPPRLGGRGSPARSRGRRPNSSDWS